MTSARAPTRHSTVSSSSRATSSVPARKPRPPLPPAQHEWKAKLLEVQPGADTRATTTEAEDLAAADERSTSIA
eukprot:708508-Prymnesium_polylepis.1